MQAQQLLTTLEKLYKLHTSLYDISLEKTEVIKKGDVESLNEFIKKEQNHISAINTLETQRQGLAAQYLEQKGVQLQGPPSLSSVIVHAQETEKAHYQKLKQKLMEITGKLKDQNELNQKLVYQSLQFINMNLSVIHPMPQQGNYTKPKQPKGQTSQNSMFDSKA